MVPFDPIKILSFYILIYIKSSYSNDHTRGSVTLPSYKSLYPKSLIFSIKGNTAYNFEDLMRIYRFEDDWVPIYDGKGEQIHVNVQLKRSCRKYKCLREGDVYTYTPKGNKLFNMVNSDITLGTDRIIWALTGAVDYANKVVYDEADINLLVIHIHHVNGRKTSFTKESGGRWREYKPIGFPPTISQDKIEIRIQSHADNPGVRIEKDDKYLKYNFGPDVKCLSVEYDRTQILRASASYSIRYPQSVVFVVKGNTALVNFDEYMEILRFYNNRWIFIYYGRGEGISINVMSKDSCENYDCTNKGDVYTYTPKGDKLFNQITLEPGGYDFHEVIFEAGDVLDMVNEVVYDESDPQNLVISIYHVCGLTMKIQKSKCGFWNNEFWLKTTKDNLEKLKEGVTPSTKPKEAHEQHNVESIHLKLS